MAHERSNGARRLARTLAAVLVLAGAGAGARADEKAGRVDALWSEGADLYNGGDQASGLVKLGQAAVLAEDPALLHRVGHLYAGASGVSGHKKEAVRLYALAADLGQPDSMAHYGEALIAGEVVARDHPRGVRLLVEARDAGYGKARELLAAIAEKQKGAMDCALAEVKALGYSPRSFSDPPLEWITVRAGTGTSRRGDVLRLSGAVKNPYSKESLYSDLSLYGYGFTRMKASTVALGGGHALELSFPDGETELSPQGRRDADAVMAKCRR